MQYANDITPLTLASTAKIRNSLPGVGFSVLFPIAWLDDRSPLLKEYRKRVYSTMRGALCADLQIRSTGEAARTAFGGCP